MHSRQAGREAAAICLCYCCALLLHCLHLDISSGILPQFISAIPFIGHNGYVCPLCGGTRAFAYFSVGEISDALHCSLLGTVVSAWLLCSLPIRVIACAVSKPEWSKRLYCLVRRVENPDWLIIMMALSMWVQLWMHYSLGFLWIPPSAIEQELMYSEFMCLSSSSSCPCSFFTGARERLSDRFSTAATTRSSREAACPSIWSASTSTPPRAASTDGRRRRLRQPGSASIHVSG